LLAQGDRTTVSVGLFAEVISYNGTALAILKLWNMVLVSGSERSGLRNGDCVSNLVSGVVVSFARAVAFEVQAVASPSMGSITTALPTY
jgi:hypothetical protein